LKPGHPECVRQADEAVKQKLQHVVGVPTLESIVTIALTQKHRKYEIQFQSARLTDSSKEITSAVLWSKQRKALSRVKEARLVLGDDWDTKDSDGQEILQHSVRLNFKKPKKGGSDSSSSLDSDKEHRIFYRACLRVNKKDSPEELAKLNPDQLREFKKRKTRYYNVAAWRKQREENKEKNLKETDDDTFDDQDRIVDIKQLLKDENGWNCSPIQSFVTRT